MSKRNFFLHKWFDMFAMLVAFSVATLQTYGGSCSACSLTDFLAMRVALINFLIFPTLVILWYLALIASGFYEREKRIPRTLTFTSINIFASVSVACLLLYVAAILCNVYMISINFMIVFWFASAITMIMIRVAYAYLTAHRPSLAGDHRRMIIMGTNARALAAARYIERHPELGCRIVGFVDDPWHGTPTLDQAGYEVVTELDGFRDYLGRNVVDDVMVYVPLRSHYDRVAECLQAAVEQGVAVHIAPDLFTATPAQPQLSLVNDLPFISMAVGAVRGHGVLIKRAIDLIGGTALLLLLLPFFIGVAIAIKLDSKGPVFFIQERVGLNKRRFKLFKFRTMVPDAEKQLAKLEHLNEVTGPAFKLQNDPRVTKLGAFLRRTSLDELPQIINVVRGDMSFVGPRPLPVRDYEGFSKDWHRRRFSVKPGITCLWQIQGRSSIPFEQWMELDMKYIDSWSVWLDIKILAQTIPAVVRGSGAY